MADPNADIPDTIEDAIDENARGPKSGSATSFTQHSLTEQIEADKYLSGKTAAANNNRGLRFTRTVSPGPND